MHISVVELSTRVIDELNVEHGRLAHAHIVKAKGHLKEANRVLDELEKALQNKKQTTTNPS